MDNLSDISYQLGWRFMDAEDEHMVVSAVWKTYDGDNNPRWWGFVLPITFSESKDGSWQSRAKIRIESYQHNCGCYIPIVSLIPIVPECDYHLWLFEQWEEEDLDAVDSWRESRGDLDAMMRRVERKIKAESEEK